MTKRISDFKGLIIITCAVLLAFASHSAHADSLKTATCFSPHGNCDQKIIQFISSAQQTLDIAIYSITHTGISQAIQDAKKRGVKVRMIVDRSQSKGVSSLVNSLEGDKVQLKIGNFSGIMHDKFTIVDGEFLETGSYNYTDNATSNNGENQLYINDATVVKAYIDNFETIFAAGTAAD